MFSCNTNVSIWHALQLVAKVSIANRLWRVANSDHWIANVLHVNSSDSFEPKPGEIFRSCKDLDLDLTLQICWNICVCQGAQVGHDEVIILSLPCDLSGRRTWLFVFHLLACKLILKRILETVAAVLRCLVDKPVVKWFVQPRCTYRNYMQG